MIRRSNEQFPPVVLLALIYSLVIISPAAAQPAAHLSRQQIAGAYNRLPLSFEPSDSYATFVARGEGYTLLLTPSGGTLSLSGATPSQVSMTLIGANASAHGAGIDQLPGKTNYLIGNDSTKWRTNVANFARVRYREVYSGVDVVYYGNQRQLEYDLVVAPGANPHKIQFAFAGIQSMRIDAGGDLLLGVPGGEIRQHKPVIYQEVNGIRQPVEGRYVRKGSRQIGFETAKYDVLRPLVIDPRLVYSTFVFGTPSPFRVDGDQANAIAVDSSGNAYITGWTTSLTFPVKGAVQPVKGDTTQLKSAFVTKLNASGTALVYSTYLGGRSSNGDEGRGIAVDSSGNAYVAGVTTSANFPITPNAFQTVVNGGAAFVSELNATGDALLYSTFLGLNVLDGADAIAVDALGNAYVTGHTQSASFPITLGAFQTTPSGIWVSKLNPAASGSASLVYSTFIGKGLPSSHAIAVDSSGNAYITGATNVAGFATPGAFQTSFQGGGNDAFVAKLNAAGSALVYSTYLGGNDADVGYGIAVDSLGDAYVAGSTSSTNFPITPGAYQGSFQGGRSHCFISKLDPGGDGLVYSTYLTGAGDTIEQCNAIAVDFAGDAYVAGSTTSITFPVTSDGFRSSVASTYKAFASELNTAGNKLIFSTYLAGTNAEFGYGVAVDPSGNAYVTGYTTSATFPVTPGAFQTDGGPCCSGKAFVTAIAANVGLRLTQSGLTFQAVQGGGAPSSQSFRVFNATSLPLNFSVATPAVSGGTWLSASPSSGSINPDQPATVTVSVNPSGLAPGDYYGQVRLDAPAAPNSPGFLTVVMNISAAGTNPGPVVQPAGLVFVGLVGAATPAAQSVHITNVTNHSSAFTATASSTSGTNWFTISPTSGSVAPGQAVDVKVQPNAGLSAGVYRGSLVLQFPQDSTTRTVDLLLVITNALNSSADFEAVPAATATCAPTKLLPVFSLLGQNFSAPVAWPTPIDVIVVDDCGTAMLSGSVVTSFSNGDPPLSLGSAKDGHWSATWVPRNPRTSSTVVTVTAQKPEVNLQGSVQAVGNVPDNPNVPLLNLSPMVSAGSYLARPSPGELVSIFGINLANGTQSASALPLTTQLQGALLVLAGRPLPLVFTSANQVNAMVPYDIVPGATYQLIAQTGTRLSVPQSVTVAAAEPAVFTTDSSGQGQGQIYIYVSATEQDLAGAGHPAKAGDVVTIYCAGLGAVTPSIDAGVAVDRLIQTVNPVGVTIAGVPANVQFAGLTPNFTGLYQVNAVVPDGLAPGDALQVVLSVAGVSSPAVTMAVRN